MQKSLRTYIHEMPQIRQLMILSDLLSVISPLGWWILSLILPETWATFGLYAYLLMGAMGIFVSFAYINNFPLCYNNSIPLRRASVGCEPQNCSNREQAKQHELDPSGKWMVRVAEKSLESDWKTT